MVKTVLKIEGMMCGMCEAHINEVIRKNVTGVQKVKSSHTKGESMLVTTEEPNIEVITQAIAGTGYKVLSSKSEPYVKKFFQAENPF